MLTMCGLRICAALVASRSKRVSIAGSSAYIEDMNLTATCVLSARWSAAQTLPMPPLPSMRTSFTCLETRKPGPSPISLDEYHRFHAGRYSRVAYGNARPGQHTTLHRCGISGAEEG